MTVLSPAGVKLVWGTSSGALKDLKQLLHLVTLENAHYSVSLHVFNYNSLDYYFPHINFAIINTSLLNDTGVLLCLIHFLFLTSKYYYL